MRLESLHPGPAIFLVGLTLVCIVSCVDTGHDPLAETAGALPVSTESDSAREHYLYGRDLLEKLRITDARTRFEQAVQEDDSLALAHLGLANTATTGKEFFDSLERAVSLADGASEGEREMILAADAGARSEPGRQKGHLTRLVEIHPEDARGHNLIGNYYFGRQDYESAVEHLTQSTRLAPEYSPPYNSLGYSYRALGRYEEAESAFKKYVELLPDEPNPYDSYAELLMKLGRFEESIEKYEKALALDSNFVASYVGIANNQMFLGRGDAARETLGKLREVARNTGETRQAEFWTAAAYLHEGDFDGALAQGKSLAAIARESGDLSTLSGDLAMQGEILLNKGSFADALERYREAGRTMQEADVPDDVREAAARAQLFNEARVALMQDDLEGAREKVDAYSAAAQTRLVPFELRRIHELNGMMALQTKDYDAAIVELKQANQQDPRVWYLLALACDGKGDVDGFQEASDKAANFNGLNLNYAFVRSKAQALRGGA